MKYSVEVEGRALEVEVVDGPDGPSATVKGGLGARLRGVPAPLFVLEQGDRRVTLGVEPDPLEPGQWLVSQGGRPPSRARVVDARARVAQKQGVGGPKGPRTLRSPMPGVIVEVRIEVGQTVHKGHVLCVLEAMKMQNEIRAEGTAVVTVVHVRVGGSVAAGAKLVELAAS